MKSELVVDVTAKEISIALVEDGRLVSLQKESRDATFAVGNIYKAKVKKLMPGLNASFVNVGHERDAFLHYLDLGSQFATYAGFLQDVMGSRKASRQSAKRHRSPRSTSTAPYPTCSPAGRNFSCR